MMETIWFTILALMIATYVVLDGFDFGAGILHLFIAKNDEERRTVLAAIGPVWDGNEVWLIASGGILVYTFPKVYSAGFSGFYMPLMMALWLLILRGLSIEFRSHEKNSLWRSFWDGLFAFSSILMTIVLGAALGNVARGVPLDGTGFFSGPLFTNFRLGPHPGVLDWYTILIGVLALLTLAGHGAMYLIWKTEGPVQERCKTLAPGIWSGVLAVGILAMFATAQIQPQLYGTLTQRPLTWLFPFVIAGSLLNVFLSLKKGREMGGFISSCLFIVSMLAAGAVMMFPNMLYSTLGAQYNLTVNNAAAGELSLKVGLFWWLLAITLAVGYFIYLFRSFRGKIKLTGEGHYSH